MKNTNYFTHLSLYFTISCNNTDLRTSQAHEDCQGPTC